MADYVRGRIYRYMAQRRCWLQRAEIVGAFDISSDCASQHLHRLREDGYIEARGFTTNRQFRAITKNGPPGDRRTVDYRDGASAESAARYRARYARRKVRKAKTKARRVASLALALVEFWPSPVRVPS